MDNKIIIDPRRSHSNFRPIKALRHFRNLIADKEDTEQVFHIIDSLRGKKFIGEAEKFARSDYGIKILNDENNLVEYLDDHATLRKTPMGSVAHAYCDFMESEGLSAAGLVAEYDKFSGSIPQYNDQIQAYGDRLRDTHDLFHVLTGYGRDPLGEQCVLAFSYSQNKNLGVYFIAYAGGWEVKKRIPKGIPVFSAIRQAQKNGAAAKRIVEQSIISLLSEQLPDARKRLNIGAADQYHHAISLCKDGGINPHDLLALPV
ncbi:hypothetical protein LPB140_00750 [Sphingorhabdus lutea]|uniref:Ubiquinone biosynthesis protein n=1 Tax=Sphingorhabdus lutea TaxID=1913578 RepID=A0A1L3J925_9SPHN|nr:Coq4 family protein [Sphingorhabdus lutea]APG61611.1 hypothetical protein LPB140_00750 [Sphingorhabdus lutea]